MDKMQMAHDYFMKHGRDGGWMELDVATAWAYADAMQAEADKRNKAEAAQKRKEMREMLSAPNTFVEREGQHFDDVNWQPDWSQAPDDAVAWVYSNVDKSGFWCHKKPIRLSRGWCTSTMLKKAPSFDYQGNWQDSLRERPEVLCEVDWRLCPSNEFTHWIQPSDGLAFWYSELNQSAAPSFGFTGTNIVERPE